MISEFTLEGVKVGDELTVREGNWSRDNEPRVVPFRPVTKVGRKYVTIGEGWNALVVHIESGIQKDESNYPSRAFKPEDYPRYLYSLELQKRWGEATKGMGWDRCLTTDQRERILAILEESVVGSVPLPEKDATP